VAAVHLFAIVGFRGRVTTVLHWVVSFVGRRRAQRVGPGFEASRSGGRSAASFGAVSSHCYTG
jgi:NADH dehydrogenase